MLGNRIDSLLIDAALPTTAAPLPPRLGLGFHEALLHPVTKLVVVAHALVVQQFGQGCLDLVIDIGNPLLIMLGVSAG